MNRFPHWTWLLALLWGSCYQPRTGCLNPQAVNYDFAADEACSDCCTWPSLRLQVKHRYQPPAQPDTLLPLKYHQPLKVFPDTAHPFSLERFRFWIGHLHLWTQDGTEYSVLDTLHVQLPDGTVVAIEDNFTVADRDIFSAQTLGSHRATGLVAGVKLRVGLDSLERALDPLSLEPEHPLRRWADSVLFDPEQGFLSGRARIMPDTASADTLDVQWLQPLELTLWLDAPAFVPRGRVVEVTLVINYTRLFEGIDFAATTAEALRFHIVANLPSAVFLESVEAK